MASLIACITFDCADCNRIARFWAAALQYEVRDDKEGWVVLKPINGSGPLLGFQQVPEPKVVKNRVHVDLKPLAGTMDTEIERLASIGAQQVRLVAENPDGVHTIMQDPEGNEFCVVA